MYLRSLLFLAAAIPAAYAQTPVTLSGELTFSGEGGGAAYMVDLRSLDTRPSPGVRTQVNGDGSFEFRHLQPGVYELVVTTLHGYALRSEIVQVNAQTSRISIRMGKSGGEAKHKGSISIRRLRYRPSKGARKEFAKAESALRNGHPQRAVEHLRRAVELDPGYAEAHNNLGVRYLVGGELDAARLHLERALALDEASCETHGNLSALALSVGDVVGAESHARRSLALGGDPAKSDYLLGLALARQGKEAAAIPRLEEAAIRFPRARLALADILTRQGDAAGAEKQLRGYLDSGSTERRPEVERWIKSLRR